MKYLLFVLPLLMGASSSLNLNLPNTSGSYQQDRIRSGQVDCSMAIGAPTSVEFGVVGILNQQDPTMNLNPELPANNDFIRDVGVYAKINIPIGAPKERIDCTKLYKIELEKQRLELLKLRQELNNLQQLQFEN
jgi:hypothetical protein